MTGRESTEPLGFRSSGAACPLACQRKAGHPGECMRRCQRETGCTEPKGHRGHCTIGTYNGIGWAL